MTTRTVMLIALALLAASCTDAKLRPAGYTEASITLTGPGTLANDMPGTYTVSAAIVRTDNQERIVAPDLYLEDDQRGQSGLPPMEDFRILESTSLTFEAGASTATTTLTLTCVAAPLLGPYLVKGNTAGALRDPIQLVAKLGAVRSAAISVNCVPIADGETKRGLNQSCSANESCEDGLVCTIGVNKCQEICKPGCLINDAGRCVKPFDASPLTCP